MAAEKFSTIFKSCDFPPNCNQLHSHTVCCLICCFSYYHSSAAQSWFVSGSSFFSTGDGVSCCSEALKHLMKSLFCRIKSFRDLVNFFFSKWHLQNAFWLMIWHYSRQHVDNPNQLLDSWFFLDTLLLVFL